jgi:hypothetical protein
MGDNLLGVLLTQSLGGVGLHDSIAVITSIAATVIIVSALRLLVHSLLVVFVVAKDGVVLLAELGGLVL